MSALKVKRPSSEDQKVGFAFPKWSSSIVYLSLLTLLLSNACQSTRVEGLWEVQQVEVGDQVVTPIARWMRFEARQKQQSGNGWFQHSYGTWNYDKAQRTLSVSNTNGYIDSNPPFLVSFENGKMYWQREEEGQAVNIQLQRIEELPTAPGNQLLGVWDMVSASSDDQDQSKSLDPNNKRYCFFRPDQRFTIQHGPQGRQGGIYQIHGHRPQLTLIFDGAECQREAWFFKVQNNSLVLERQQDGKSLRLEYQRIDHFPQ